MSTRAHCGRHSIDYSGDSCPRCDAEDRHRELLNATEEGVAETVDAMRQSDYRRANPGDYACPHCKYVSLKYCASLCPLCHGQVEYEYWARVFIAEAAARERQRLAQETADAEERREAPIRAAAEAKAAIREGWRKFFLVYVAYLLPALTGATSILAQGLKLRNPGEAFVLLLIPILNWLMVLIVVVSEESQRLVTVASLMLWAIVGGVAYVTILPRRVS